MIDNSGNTKKIEVYPQTGAILVDKETWEADHETYFDDLRFMAKTFGIITLDLNLEETTEGLILQWRPHPQEETIKRWNDRRAVGSDPGFPGLRGQQQGPNQEPSIRSDPNT